MNSWNFNNSVYLFQGLPKGAMLTHRGTMATVVAAGAVLVRSFNWDIVIVFLAFVFTALFKILFYAIHEFKKFFIRESIIHRYLFCCLSYNFCFNYKCKEKHLFSLDHQRFWFYALYTLCWAEYFKYWCIFLYFRNLVA